MSEDMVIFVRTFDMLTWLLPRAEAFPKIQRFVITQRLVGAALDFQEALYDANARTDKRRLDNLEAADAHLNKLRLYLRLAFGWGWLKDGQYQHVSAMIAEIGRLLSGWIKQTRSYAKSASGERSRTHRTRRICPTPCFRRAAQTGLRFSSASPRSANSPSANIAGTQTGRPAGPPQAAQLAPPDSGATEDGRRVDDPHPRKPMLLFRLSG